MDEERPCGSFPFLKCLNNLMKLNEDLCVYFSTYLKYMQMLLVYLFGKTG